MEYMRIGRHSVLGVVVLVAALLGNACATSGSGSTGNTGPINIGVAVAYTGRYQAYGTALFQGSEVAAKLINLSGGVMGRPVNVIPLDTAGDPIDAVTVIRKALAFDNLSGIVGLTGADYQNAWPIVNQAHMVSMNHIADPAIDQVLQPYSFATVASDALLGAAMAKYAATAGYHNIALVFDAEAGAQTVIPAIKVAAQHLNLQIVASPSLPTDAPSYEAAILQIQAAKPDAILMQLDPPGAGAFFQGLKKLGGTNIPVIGTDVTATAEWAKAVGVQVVTNEETAIQSAGGQTGPSWTFFQPQFQEMFNASVPFFAQQGYDGLNVMALAMIDAHSVNPTVYVNKVLDVTNLGSGITTVYNFGDGAKLLGQGTKIKYYGVGSPLVYDRYHRVTADFQATKDSPALDGNSTHVADIPGTSLVGLT